MPAQKPRIAVSQCLLGDRVRYDGQHSKNTIITQQLTAHFEIIPVCPEVEAGLSIPRPPVQLTASIASPQMTGRDDNKINVTKIMQTYCNNKPAQLKNICGYVFKSRSPSCGLNSTPVFIGDDCVTETSRGVFARVICEHFPRVACY